MSAKHVRFRDDEEDEVEDYNSESDYDTNEKQLLAKFRGKNLEPSDSEEEVYNVKSDASSDIALSDVEGQDLDDDLPDVRAWGKDKRHYYSTDYVDPDYGGFQGRDAAFAEFEEKEARNLQKQFLEQLDDEDFTLNFVQKSAAESDKKQTEEIVKTDVSKLSKRQKIDLLQKESPEFFGLIEDFKSKIAIINEYILPLKKLLKDLEINKTTAVEFVDVYYTTIMNYLVNINMYLVLKASKSNVQNHPIIKRLFQYRKIFGQLDLIFDNIKPQIETLMDKQKNNLNNVNHEPTRKTLKILQNTLLRKVDQIDKPCKSEEQPAKKKIKLSKSEEPVQTSELSNDSEDYSKDNEKIEYSANQDQTNLRRSITYQMAKNKGLTPHRNKLQRNPRVKHRNKYRQAKIRRKGAIREVKTETSRYGGEISGIKASVTKSIKIKS